MLQNLYVLQLLHKRLKIVHNDLHSSNILIVNDHEPVKKYKIGRRTYKLMGHPYSLMVYDFDNSSMKCNKNPFLSKWFKKEYGVGDNPQKDIFLWYRLILLNEFGFDESKIQQFRRQIYQLAPSIREADKIADSTFWSNYRIGNKSSPHVKDFTISNIAPIFFKIFC